MKVFTAIGLALIILVTSFLNIPGVATARTTVAESTSYLTPHQLSWMDEFNSSTLDNRWTWVREDDSLWSLTDNPGYMQITSDGSLHQDANNQRNILLTTAPAGDFRITTRVRVTPTEDFHGAVLYVYQDDDNYVGVTRIYNGNIGGASVAIRTEVDGERWGYYVPVTQDDILLRILKEGDVYSGWFSEDNGFTWDYIEQFRAEFTDLRVGPSVRMGPTETPLTANFDWVKIESYMEQIFLPFFTTKDIDKGTGIGLAVVHGIITSHGGSIDVISKENVGTCFQITLPILSDD